MARLSDLRAAYETQQASLVQWLEQLPSEAWDERSTLDEWSVRELAFHVTDSTVAVVQAVADGPVRDTALSLAAYIAAFPAAAPEIAQRNRDGAADLDRSGVLANAAKAREDLLATLATLDDDPVVLGRRGPIKVSDLMATRINELVVHSLDLSASLSDRDPVPLERGALAITCRMLTGILAEQVPGHTVEVRVPPFAAIQCVEGPRHTRGTPANVVETDPLTWIKLATGRERWPAAVARGVVSASGDRADISAYLPVLS